jgi:CDP-diacylglycerol--glycerol-3-phosphate 3-phosphatidyltransferase
MKRFLRHVPMGLIAFRGLAAVLIVALAFGLGLKARTPIVALILLGGLSDLLDGIVARMLNVATVTLRRFDSQADLVFGLAVLVATWRLWPTEMRALMPYFAGLIVLEIACYATSFARFGRETSTHSYLSKLWGVSLIATFAVLVASGSTGILFDVMFAIGIISQLDVIGISLLLPQWTNDVPSSYHAWLLRRGLPIRRYRLLN